MKQKSVLSVLAALVATLSGQVAKADYRPQPVVDLAEPRFVRQGSAIKDRWQEQLEQAVSEASSSTSGQDSCDYVSLSKDRLNCVKMADVCVESEEREHAPCRNSDYGMGMSDCGKKYTFCLKSERKDVGYGVLYADLDDIKRGDGLTCSDNVYFENKAGGSYYIDFEEEAQATRFASSLARVAYMAQRMNQDTRHHPLKAERDRSLERKAQCARRAFDNYQRHGTKLNAINAITACLGKQEQEIMDYITKRNPYQDAAKDEAFRNLVDKAAKMSVDFAL